MAPPSSDAVPREPTPGSGRRAIPDPGPPPASARRSPTLARRLRSLLLLGLLFLVAVMSLVTYLSFARFRQGVLDERLLLARTVAQSLDSMLARSFQSLRQLPSRLPELDESATDELRTFRFQCLFREAVFLLDEDGQVLASDPSFAAPALGPPWPEEETVTSLLEGHGGLNRPTLAAVQPFRRQGRTYRLVAEMNPLGSTFSTFLQSLAPEPELHIVVVDRRGRIIAASDQRYLFRTVEPAEVLAARIASHRSFLSANEPCTACGPDAERTDGFLTAMAPLRAASWGVVVQQHQGVAFSGVYTAQTVLLGAVVLLVVSGLVLSRAVSRSVVTPIERLSRQAEALREGDLSQPIEVQGDREVRVLASTLDGARRQLAATLTELEDLNESLEHQVADRTRKLRAQDAQRKHLVRRLLYAGEEERRRIARELHDEISQLLAVIQLSLADVERDTPELRKARKLLSKTQKEVHRIIYDLRPSILDDLGLAAAVRWYADNYLTPRGLEIHLEVEEGLDLPEEVEISVFRIYQEIVTNILRHSRAESVSIELYIRDSRLVLAVEDDGIGFSPSEWAPGAGVTGMRERADLIGAELEIDSEPGLGTQVQLEIPLDHAAADRHDAERAVGTAAARGTS